MFGLGLGRLGASGSAFTPASVAGKRLWLRPSVTAGMFTTGLSATGNAPATHYVSSGPISDEMAALLPCTSVTLDTEGNPVITTAPGMPTAVPALALEAGITVTQSAVNSLYAAIDVSDQSAQEAMDRLGLQMVRVSMP